MVLATPDTARILFDRMSQAANGFTTDSVVVAAGNLLVNSVRQSQTSREKAGARFDELAAKLKSALMDSYDGFGRKKGIFPYPQEINASLVNFRKPNGR